MIYFVDSNVRKILEKINITGTLKKNEPMAAHTTYRTGGPAEYFFVPESYEDLRMLLLFSREFHVPCFILGEGANILVSDLGIQGMVIAMHHFNRIECRGTICTAESGTLISLTAETAGSLGLSGLEFIYAMPGTVGGAIWMNARCYGSSVSDILYAVEYLDKDFNVKRLEKEDIQKTFRYKKSFFQESWGLILKGEFALHPGNEQHIYQVMQDHRQDRKQKGHFRYPSAGSVFKNNRAFGQPTGTILDSLGLKGRSIGGAQVAEFHGNIIINRDGATSQDIRDLIELCEREAEVKRGIHLEREVQFVGTWK